jgi:hypothetical protein
MGEGEEAQDERVGRFEYRQTERTEEREGEVVSDAFTLKETGSEGKETGKRLRDGFRASNFR